MSKPQQTPFTPLRFSSSAPLVQTTRSDWNLHNIICITYMQSVRVNQWLKLLQYYLHDINPQDVSWFIKEPQVQFLKRDILHVITHHEVSYSECTWVKDKKICTEYKGNVGALAALSGPPSLCFTPCQQQRLYHSEPHTEYRGNTALQAPHSVKRQRLYVSHSCSYTLGLFPLSLASSQLSVGK